MFSGHEPLANSTKNEVLASSLLAQDSSQRRFHLMETKSSMSVGSLVGLAAIVLVLWFCFNALSNNQKLQTGIHYLQTGQTQLDYHQLARQDAQHSGIPGSRHFSPPFSPLRERKPRNGNKNLILLFSLPKSG